MQGPDDHEFSEEDLQQIRALFDAMDVDQSEFIKEVQWPAISPFPAEPQQGHCIPFVASCSQQTCVFSMNWTRHLNAWGSILMLVVLVLMDTRALHDHTGGIRL